MAWYEHSLNVGLEHTFERGKVNLPLSIGKKISEAAFRRAIPVFLPSNRRYYGEAFKHIFN